MSSRRVLLAASLIAGALVVLVVLLVTVRLASRIGLLPETDQIPPLANAGWEQLLSGHRAPMGVAEKPEPFVLLGTNNEDTAIARLETVLRSEGWEVDLEPVIGGGVRFLPRGCGPDCDRFMVLRVFPGQAFQDYPYGIRQDELRRWQSQFRAIYILENFHLYPLKAW